MGIESGPGLEGRAWILVNDDVVDAQRGCGAKVPPDKYGVSVGSVRVNYLI